MRHLCLLLCLSGCAGLWSVPGQGPAPDAAGEEDPPEPVVVTPQPEPATPQVAADDPLSDRLPLPLVASVRAARAAMDQAETADAVAAAWRQAQLLAPPLEAVLQPAYDAQDQAPLDLDWLTPHLPGLSETYMAEGTAVVLIIEPEPWKARAATTPSSADDRFFEAFSAVWGPTLRPVGWPVWQERTWDYGGCSALGKGRVAKALVAIDVAAAEGQRFADELSELRQLAMNHVLLDDDLFPRCDAEAGLEPTATAALQAEIDTILAQVRLSDAERAGLLARRSSIKGQAHTGG